MSRLARVEVWSNVQCASGTRLGIVQQVHTLTETLAVNQDHRLDLVMRVADSVAAQIAERRVVRVINEDATFTEWRIQRIRTSRESESLIRVECVSIGQDLLNAIVRRTENDGLVHYDFEGLGLTPTEQINTFLLAACTAAGMTWVAIGTVTPTAPIDVVYSSSSVLDVMKRMAEATGYEWQLRRNGTTNYQLDLILTIGSGSTVSDIRLGRNLRGVERERHDIELATHVIPRGYAEDGFHATMARARWKVTGVAGSVITLADEVTGEGPVLEDDQLNGFYLRKVAGTLTQITDSDASSSTVTVASATGIATNDIIEIRADSVGTHLTHLPYPSKVTLYGIVPKVLDRPNIPATVNLIKNPTMRLWAGASSVPPDDWASVSTPTVTRTTTATRWRVGGKSCRVETNADGEGIKTPTMTIAPSTSFRYFSGFVSLYLAAGRVRVELVATDGVTTWVFPSGTDGKAFTSQLNTWVDLGVAGIDLQELGATSAYLRVVQDGATNADMYVDAAQLVHEAVQRPFIEGSGPTQLWLEANRYLEKYGAPLVSYRVNVLDLAELDAVTFSVLGFTLGGEVRINDSELGLSAQTRVLSMRRDRLQEAIIELTLSNKPEDLTDALVRPKKPERQPRQPNSSQEPTISLFVDGVAGQPDVRQVKLTAQPSTAKIFFYLDDEGTTVPVIGSASYTEYSAPINVNVDQTLRIQLAAYAQIGDRVSRVFVWLVDADAAPDLELTLGENPAGTLTVDWIADDDIVKVRLYRRKSATNGQWPTTNAAVDGPLDATYFVREMAVDADGGGFDATGAPIAGGTSWTEAGYAGTDYAMIILVGITHDGAVARFSASRDMTGVVTPLITSATVTSPRADDGTACEDPAVDVISWTVNSGVVNATHDIKVYVRYNGGGWGLVGTEASPTTNLSMNVPLLGHKTTGKFDPVYDVDIKLELVVTSGGAILQTVQRAADDLKTSCVP